MMKFDNVQFNEKQRKIMLVGKLGGTMQCPFCEGNEVVRIGPVKVVSKCRTCDIMWISDERTENGYITVVMEHEEIKKEKRRKNDTTL